MENGQFCVVSLVFRWSIREFVCRVHGIYFIHILRCPNWPLLTTWIHYDLFLWMCPLNRPSSNGHSVSFSFKWIASIVDSPNTFQFNTQMHTFGQNQFTEMIVDYSFIRIRLWIHNDIYYRWHIQFGSIYGHQNENLHCWFLYHFFQSIKST